MGGGASQEEIAAVLEQQRKVHMALFERERKAMQAIDASTKVGHLLIELRNLGFVELQGKDIGGIYAKLDQWLGKTWGARRPKQDVRPGARRLDCCSGYGVKNRVEDRQPYDELCDASYILGSHLSDGGTPVKNDVFKSRGYEGENNMGKLTMQLVNFMTNTCGWTLQTCDGGNCGSEGLIREQQIKFKAPHPLNLIAPHVMIELRAVGYVEINGVDSSGIFEKLHGFLTKSWRATKIHADPGYCDRKYEACDVFKKRGEEGENNMGFRTMQVVNFMVQRCAWTMITCNGGNFGLFGVKREQQLVFRNDGFVQHGEKHVMVELRSCGYIEVNGLDDAQDFAEAFEGFAKSGWRCVHYKPKFMESDTKFCDVKYQTSDGFYYQEQLANNLGKRTIELAQFAQGIGWSLLLCNGGNIRRRGCNRIIREQQVKFTKCKKKEDALPALLMIEMRTQPTEQPIELRGLPRWDGYM